MKILLAIYILGRLLHSNMQCTVRRGESKVAYVAWRQVISNGKKFKMMSGGRLRMIKARNSTNMAKKEQVTVVSTWGSFNKTAGAAPGSEINLIFHVITIASSVATFCCRE
jgi:N6-adenosine-specific RNA methylase IME4